MLYSHNNLLLINAYSIHTVLSSVKDRGKLITCEEMNYMLSFNGITYLENGYELFLLHFQIKKKSILGLGQVTEEANYINISMYKITSKT